MMKLVPKKRIPCKDLSNTLCRFFVDVDDWTEATRLSSTNVTMRGRRWGRSWSLSGCGRRAAGPVGGGRECPRRSDLLLLPQVLSEAPSSSSGISLLGTGGELSTTGIDESLSGPELLVEYPEVGRES